MKEKLEGYDVIGDARDQNQFELISLMYQKRKTINLEQKFKEKLWELVAETEWIEYYMRPNCKHDYIIMLSTLLFDPESLITTKIQYHFCK